jgi:predicted RNA-binding protein with EMAP domain
MNAHQLVINELLNETSSSSEDESYLDNLLITNAASGKRRIEKIVNFQSTVVAAWDNQQFRKVFRMNRSTMQFIPFEFLDSEDYPSRLCKIKNMAEKYALAFLWLVILGASENYVVFKAHHMLLDIMHAFTNQSAD